MAPTSLKILFSSCTGDIIVKINDVPVSKMEDLLSVIDEKQPGTSVKLSVTSQSGKRQRTLEWPLIDMNADE